MTATECGRLLAVRRYGQCGNYYGRQLFSLRDVSAKQENVGPTVPRIPNMDTMVETMLKHQPDDEVCVIHGDWKFVRVFRDVLHMCVVSVRC